MGRTRQQERERTKRRGVNARRMVEQAKAERGNRCDECGGVFHHCQLDFAHLNEHREKKSKRLKGTGYGLSQLARSWGHEFYRELKICRLLCANCHRLETWQNKHWIPIGVKVEEDPQEQLFPLPTKSLKRFS